MKNFKKTTTLIAAALLSAGASKPGAIAPVSMAGAYDGVSCDRAQQLYAQEAAKIPTLFAAQNSAVTGDALGVFLIGVPVSSLTGGEVEGEIAATKDKLLALAARLEACGRPVAQTYF